MWSELDTLDQAIETVKQEQSSLQTECDAFEEFRDAVSSISAHRPDEASGGRENRVLDEYRRTVMATPGFETAYSNSLSEHLEAEFTPSIADTLLSDKQLTQKEKRDLLLATTYGIDHRQAFIQTLETELRSLQKARDTVINVKSTIDELPPCSIESLSFDTYIDIWEATKTLLDQCERRLQYRQERIGSIRQNHPAPEDEHHVLNEYLYSNLETSYPALRGLTTTISRIRRFRGETEADTPSREISIEIR